MGVERSEFPYDIGGEEAAECGGHVADGAGCGFLVPFALDGHDGCAVGLLGGEDDGEFPAAQAGAGQIVADCLGQPTVVRVPKVVLTDLRDVRLRPGAHRRDDGLVSAQGLNEQGAFGGDGVDGVDDEVEVLVEEGGHIVGREIRSADVEVEAGIDVEETAGEDVHLFCPTREWRAGSWRLMFEGATQSASMRVSLPTPARQSISAA